MKHLLEGDIDHTPTPHDGTIQGFITALDEDENKMQLQLKRNMIVWDFLNSLSFWRSPKARRRIQ